MEYVELDFLGTAAVIDPHFLELFENLTSYKLQNKKLLSGNNLSRYTKKLSCIEIL